MGKAYTAGNTEWRYPGERVLLFLSRRTEKPGGLCPRGRQAHPAVCTRTTGDPVVQHIGSLSLPELCSEVENAKSRIEKGEVEPLKREF